MDPYLAAPDLYVEITSDEFRCSPKHTPLHSYLHPNWYTKRVYRIHPFQSGIYLLFDLHKNPHYQLPTNDRDKFNTIARKRKIHVFDVSNFSYSIPNEIYHYANTSTIYKHSVQPLIPSIDFMKIIDLLDNKIICSRGNIAHNVGWHTLNFKFQGTINVPCHSTVTDLDKSNFKMLTKCFKKVFRNVINPLPFSTDPKRTREFANKLMHINCSKQSSFDDRKIENVFESMTYAITYLKNESTLLLPHIDSLNCSQQGYNAVFGMYFNMNHPKKKDTPIRLIILGYSRKSIHDFYKRLDKRRLLKSHLLSYYNLLGDRKYLTIQNAIPYDSTRKEQSCIQHLPFVDKCGFYSIFVSCIYDLIHNGKEKISFDQLLELMLPIGWLTTGTNYYKVIKSWEKHGLPTGNLTIAIVHNLISIGGSISSGSGPRLQPYANKYISKVDLNSALICLKEVVISTNTSNNIDIEYVYKTLTKNIKYLGFIGAQHLISSLTLLRIIRNPLFVREAFLLSNTNTEKKIKKIYSLSHKLTNILFNEISNEHFEGCSRKVENLCCEFFRDIKDPFQSIDHHCYLDSINKRTRSSIRYPDSFYSTQAIFIEDKNIIYRYQYSSSGKVVCEKVPESLLKVSNSAITTSHFNTINVENLAFSSSQMKAMYSSKSISMSTMDTIEHQSKRSKIVPNNEERLCIFDHEQYHFVQYDILQILKIKNTSHSLTKFTYKNNWFSGNYITFNSTQTLQSILGSPKKKMLERKGNKYFDCIRIFLLITQFLILHHMPVPVGYYIYLQAILTST